ncbi:phage tail protein [Streptomyces sp. NRRL F-5123]|uniref:phage tail protein n=1 Tax=Streptomyces sp. NRRL F-5123 TaxID=1463856 RepID=UPI0004E16373|nr:hypothetical protein [Streptomyces sp. NRRL F-5123]
MPAGQVIGRVSVRVLPDTDSFRRDAQKKLDVIEKQLEVPVQTKADMTGFLTQMLTEIRKISQQNRQSDARKIKLYTRIDTSTMTGELAKAIRQYNAKARSGSKVQLQTELDAGDVKLAISEESLKEMTHKLKKWRDDNSPLKIKIEPDVASSSSLAASARLGVLTRPRTVSIVPQINKAALAKVSTLLAALSGLRVLDRLFSGFRDFIKDLDRSVPLIGTLAAAIAGVAGWILSATSNLFALSASLANIGPTIALLPGLLGGFAVGIGVTVAALKDFNKEIPEVKAALHALQDSISARFWDQARAPIKEMVDELLPEFTAGVNKTATQLGNFFGGLATSLKGALDPELNQMFVDLSSSIHIATTGTGAFANIITVLGRVGTSYLPQLSQWFVNISKQFSDFLKAKGDNGITAEIDEGIQALKDLGGVLHNTYGILSGVAKAATDAGGTSLASLNNALAGIHKTVDSPGWQSGMVDVFKAAHTAMDNIANQSGPAVKTLFKQLGSLLTTVLPEAGDIIGKALGGIANALSQPAISQGISALFDGLDGAVTALLPALDPVGQLLAALAQVVATMLPVFAKLVSAAVIPLAGALSALAPSITPIISLLGGALTQAVQMLAPYIQQLSPLVGQLLSAAFDTLAAILPPVTAIFGDLLAAVVPLAKALISNLTPVLPVLGDALGQVLTALEPLVETALQIVTAVILPLLPVLSQLLQQLLPPLADAITRVAEAIEPILIALLQVVTVLMPVLAPTISFLATLLGTILVDAVNAVAEVFEGLVEICIGVWDTIVGAIELAWGLISGIFTGSFSTLAQGWSDFWNGIYNIVHGVWDIILGALRLFLDIGFLGEVSKGMKAIGAGFQAGWRVITDLFTANFATIRSYITLFSSGARQAFVDAMASIGRSISSAWTTIRTTAETELGKLVTTVSTWIGKAVTEVGTLPGKAQAALSTMSTVLVAAGKALITGFIDGIKSKFGAVKSTLGGLTSKLTSWKGPESLDRVLLVGAGQLVIGGFIKGLESRYDAVRRSLQGLTDDVAGTQFQIPGVSAAGVSGGVSGAVAAALSGSTGGTTKVLNYYAAPGSSLGSEEDLFAAANRARMGW